MLLWLFLFSMGIVYTHKDIVRYQDVIEFVMCVCVHTTFSMHTVEKTPVRRCSRARARRDVD